MEALVAAGLPPAPAVAEPGQGAVEAKAAESKAADVVMATGEAKADGVVGDPGGVDGVVGSDVVDETLGSLDGGIDGLFLPEYVLGSRVLLAKEHGEFELDNTSLLAEGGPAFPSVAFRLSPSLPDKHMTKVTHWGSRLRATSGMAGFESRPQHPRLLRLLRARNTRRYRSADELALSRT